MPQVPSVIAFSSEEEAAISVMVNNPDSVDHNIIFRRSEYETDWITLGTVGQDGTYKDIEAASGTSYTYRAKAVDSEDVESNYSGQSTASVTLHDWYIKDLEEPEDSIKVLISSSDLRLVTEEHQAAFNPYGRTYPMVIKDQMIRAEQFNIQFDFLGDDLWLAFKKLRYKQKILLLQAPGRDMQWYFSFGSQGREIILNLNPPVWRQFEVEIIVVGRP